MKLLNLWPQNEVVVQPVKRFVLEAIFAVLVVLAITLASWLWFTWRLNHAMAAHQTLQGEWVRLKQQKEVENASITQSPRALRQMISGELDWMGELPEWIQGGRVRWLSAHNPKNHLLLHGMAQEGVDIEALAEQIRARYPEPPLTISEVSAVVVDGQKWWHFSMRVDGVNIMHRWVLPKNNGNTAPPSAPATESNSSGESQ